MTKLISRYKVKTGTQEKKLANVLYDFVIVAIASLIFNGFIINSMSSNFDQKIFMVINAGLLSTHWYARTFFSQRYEKKGMDFRALLFLSIFSLGAMAISIDLQVFSKNQTPTQQDFLSKASMYIWFAGFIGSRLLVSFNYMMAAIANKSNDSLFKLTIYKSVSRMINIALAIAGIILLSQGVERSVIIYSIFPLFVVIEYIGNVFFVTDKVLEGAPQVSYESLKERYSRINNILISAFVISGSIQFAFYFKESTDLYMLGRVAALYIVSFLMWWTYSNRVYRFGIKPIAKSHVILGASNILIAGSLALMGGMLINANNDKNLSIIIPTVLLALTAFIILITANIYTFTNSTKNEVFNKAIKIRFIIEALIAVVALLTMGLLSIFFDFSVWVMYGTVIGSLSWLALTARYDIHHKVKNNI